MTRLIRMAAFAVAVFAGGAASAADVGVSVNIGQPGFYGQIDIGNVARPQVIYQQPVWIQRQPVQVAPIYLRVSPGHAKNWRRYCNYYNACNRPVYFVRDDWYRNTYVPYYRAHDDGRWNRDRDRSYDRRDDRDHDDDRGKGKRGKGHGKGHDKDD